MADGRRLEHDLFGTAPRNPNINSREKGITNERECAKTLKKWTGEKFARVPSSGGLRWSNTANACGDLICQNSDYNFPFTVETKHLKELSFKRHLSTRAKVYTIYKQAYRDAYRAKKCPLMMLRTNGMAKGAYMCFFPFTLPALTSDCNGQLPDAPYTRLFGYSTEQITPEIFKEACEQAVNWINRNFVENVDNG